MSTYENTSRSIAYREALILIANRHDLLVYFDFGIDFNVLPFRFVLDECEIMRGSLDLSEKISYHDFELLEKDLEDGIEKIRNRSIGKKGEVEMKKEELIRELYASRVMDAIREKYREAGAKQDELSRRHEKILKKLESGEGCMMTWRDHEDLEVELSECRRKRDEMKIVRNVWRQARELCMDIADGMMKENKDEENKFE